MLALRYNLFSDPAPQTTNMKSNNSSFKLTFFTVLSFISVLIPILIWVLWSYCFNSQTNQADRVKMFESYFPESLNGQFTISLISLLLCFLSIILSSIYLNRKTPLLRAISIVVIVAGSLMTLLSLFSLM